MTHTPGHDTGDHCPHCFNAGYDAELNGITRDLRDAAPALLAALEAFLDMTYTDIKRDSHEWFGLCNDASAAVKAAKGETQ